MQRFKRGILGYALFFITLLVLQMLSIFTGLYVAEMTTCVVVLGMMGIVMSLYRLKRFMALRECYLILPTLALLLYLSVLIALFYRAFRG